MRRYAWLATLTLTLVVSGCATLRENPKACRIGVNVLGTAIGGTAGGLLVSEYEPTPTDGERAAGAGGGAAAGLIIGALLGHPICGEEAKPAPPPPAPEPPPAPKKIETLTGPSFDFDKATLRPAGKDKLDHVAQVMKADPTMRVSANGYTDSVGSDAYNQRLSQRRAEAARSYLVAQGIEASRITARGFGESNPVTSNDTAEGRAENRRVEIIAE